MFESHDPPSSITPTTLEQSHDTKELNRVQPALFTRGKLVDNSVARAATSVRPVPCAGTSSPRPWELARPSTPPQPFIDRFSPTVRGRTKALVARAH